MERAHILLLSALAAACAGSEPTPGDAAARVDAVPVHAATAPELSIGVLEGNAEYLFESVQSVLRLEDGRLVVADAGGARIALYDADGTFLDAFGGEGGGPGEFGTLARIYGHGPDSLLALDARRTRISVFGLDGGFARQVDAAEISGDSTYRADVWPHRRFLVRGAFHPDEREAARAALAAVPNPRGAVLSRPAWWTGTGELWLREPRHGTGPSSWLVVDGGGTPLRWVDLPADFHPLYREGDWVWGRTVGEFDVEFVQGYALGDPGPSRPVPEWMASPAPVEDSAPVDRETLLAAVRSSVKWVASAQEIHYAQHYSYSSDLNALEIPSEELLEGLEIQILSAGTRGWAMIAAHPDAAEICTLGYGLDTPPGWPGGTVSCGG